MRNFATLGPFITSIVILMAIEYNPPLISFNMVMNGVILNLYRMRDIGTLILLNLEKLILVPRTGFDTTHPRNHYIVFVVVLSILT